MRITLILVHLLLLSWNSAQAFSVSRQISSCAGIRSRQVEALYSSSSSEEEEGDNGSHDENQVSPEVVEPNLTVATTTTTTTPTSSGIEKAWRHAKKPLLRIGSKGFSKSHGNSLRQLLEDHVVVKVKLNTEKYGTSIDETLRHIHPFWTMTMTTPRIQIIFEFQNIVVFITT